LNISVSANAKGIFELLREDLAAVEQEFGRGSVSTVAAVTEIGEYLRGGGGKRLRPALLLLAAKLMDYRGVGAIRLGAVVEILHTATLLHDDIIDDAQTRRGRPSANTQWGNSRCVLAGDWLYMQAFRIAVAERNFRVLDLLTSLTQQMVEGELLQMEKLGLPIALEEHLDLIYRKTACLFSACAELGGVLGGASEVQLRALAAYGRSVGMAFQIVDDVLDLTASEEVLGKPVASDLREGKATMAVLHAIERCTEVERQQIEKVLRERALNGIRHSDVLTILSRYGSLDYANAQAGQYAQAAAAAWRAFRTMNSSAPCCGCPRSWWRARNRRLAHFRLKIADFRF
jgi:octaprenyl-diphosphate synthase